MKLFNIKQAGTQIDLELEPN